MKNYEALNDNVDLAIGTFERLKNRIDYLEGESHLIIRNDTIANNYIESLNRLRDCYEHNLKDQEKKSMIIKYVLTQFESNETFNDEIVYLLFLYLVRLNNGLHSSSVLIHSIILKDHKDIKIKKEA